MAQNHRQIWIIDHVCKKPVPVFGLLSEALFLNAKIKTLLVHLWTTPRYCISVYQVIVLVLFRANLGRELPKGSLWKAILVAHPPISLGDINLLLEMWKKLFIKQTK